MYGGSIPSDGSTITKQVNMNKKEKRQQQLKELGFKPSGQGSYQYSDNKNFKIAARTITHAKNEMWDNILETFKK